MLQVGQLAPLFDLPDADMELFSLEQFRARKNVVLYFYPKDDTPGCTMEAIDFSDMEDEFSSLDTIVVGVSMDECMSHSEFRDKHGLSFSLLADVEGEVCGNYGVLQDRERDGRHKTCIQRSTFIIDKRGTLVHVQYGVSPRGHAAEVLKIIRSNGKWK